MKESAPLRLCSKRSASVASLTRSTSAKEKPQKGECGEKLKAANFHGVFLEIGSWKWESVNPGDLVAKFYYAKKKMVWEFLFGGLKKKMEMSWSAISAINAFLSEEQNGRLEIELIEPPQFSQEINCRKGKHTQWTKTTDFTQDQALICRRHMIECSPGVINKHFERLIQCDKRLLDLSQKPFPIHHSLFFPNSCLNFSHNPNAVACSSSPVAKRHRQAVHSHVQNMVPPTDHFAPHYSPGLPSSALDPSISQEMQMTSAVWDQSRNLSSIPIRQQDSLQPLDELPELNMMDIQCLIEHSNEPDGCAIDSTIKALDESYLNNSQIGGDTMISHGGNGLAGVDQDWLAVAARMDDFNSFINVTNHIANLEKEIFSLEELGFNDGLLALPGLSSWSPSQASIHGFDNGDDGKDQMGFSVDNP